MGAALVLVGISEGWSISDVAAMLPIAMALAVLAETCSAFGLHYGGALLGAEWEPFGPGWGLLGHAGLLASSEVASPALLYDLPRLTVALLPPLVVLRGRAQPWVRYAVALVCGLLSPCGRQPGRWRRLAGRLGATLGLGAGCRCRFGEPAAGDHAATLGVGWPCRAPGWPGQGRSAAGPSAATCCWAACWRCCWLALLLGSGDSRGSP